MKKVAAILLIIAMLSMIFTGGVWAKPGKEAIPGKGNKANQPGNGAIRSSKVDKENRINGTGKPDKVKEDKGSSANKSMEFITEDGFHVEIKNGKIEIKGNGTKLEYSEGKLEYASDKGKIEVRGNKGTGSGNPKLKEFKQKAKIYKKMIREGKELGNAYSDTKGHWAENVVKKLSAIGIFSGYEDGTFKPDKTITGGEVVGLIMKLVEENETEDAAVNEDELNEVEEWVREDVEKAAKLGIINLNRFHSHVQMNRAETAVIIAKALKLEPVKVEEVPFADGILISPEDVGYILALYEQGIIKGSPDGKFNPNSAITRAEMAAIIEKIIENQEDADETGDEGNSEQDQGDQDNENSQ